jgi:alkylation response protein AidB-like acyl-CoA dehydrogenase
MDFDKEFLDKAEAFLKAEVAPNAQRIDDDPSAMRTALAGLCRNELMALKRPVEYGGPNLSDSAVRCFQEMIARYSGALAFLQTQHQGVVGMIASSANENLRTQYLPAMADGERLVGVGFSQLRRPGPPIMRADPIAGGYELNGHVPWVTGWEFFPEFMVGAQLPDGSAVFGVTPLSSQAGVTVSVPMKLAAMSAANTVTVDFDHYLLRDERVALIREAGWIQHNDQINIAQQGAFALGCARAGLDILLGNSERRNSDFGRAAHQRLEAELDEIKIETETARTRVLEETTDERLRLRARQIDLAVRCAHAAVASSGGAANSLDHPAQRVYREALVFTVSAQTVPIMRATLERISRDA